MTVHDHGSGEHAPEAHAFLLSALAHELNCSADQILLVSLGGGCINRAYRVEVPDRAPGFLKWHARPSSAGVFEAEADGLAMLATVPGLRVPEVWAWDDSGAVPWLLMEFVEAGPPSLDYWRDLGSAVAALHGGASANPPALPGWHRHNWIGSLPQSNTRRETWTDFFVDQRLRPQLDLAFQGGELTDRDFWDEVVAVAGRVLTEVVEPLSRLHGDLWNGNAYPDRRGRPVLIDPAVYVGHREVDMAMVDLFGGFAPGFHQQYRTLLPISGQYERVRRDLYQLYPLLVHVNLFSGGYVQQAERTARGVLHAAPD